MQHVEAYPLHWPQGRGRSRYRKSAAFGKKTRTNGWTNKMQLSVAEATHRLLDELRMLGISQGGAIISTNLKVRLDGLPRSSQKKPDDPGVSVWFVYDGQPTCLACDRYDRVADNMAAIAKHIEATRAIARHGVGSVADVFRGFKALPETGTPSSWRAALGFEAGAKPDFHAVKRRFWELSRTHHPDRGGSHEEFIHLQTALADAEKELLA